MYYNFTQAELMVAVEFYMNEVLLQQPIKIKTIKQDHKMIGTAGGGVLHVVVEDEGNFPDTMYNKKVRMQEVEHPKGKVTFRNSSGEEKVMELKETTAAEKAAERLT
jgi:hypothetical protein